MTSILRRRQKRSLPPSWLAGCLLPLLWVASAHAQSTAAGWQKFEQCPVLVERTVELAANQSGVLEALDVEENGSVKRGEPVARLEVGIAEMDVQIAQLEYELAKRLANDNSRVEYEKFALQAAEQELANRMKIIESVTSSEIRRLELTVERAKVAVTVERQARERATVETQLRAAGVEARRLKLAQRTISSPISGVVSEVLKRPGEWVQVGDPVVRVRDLKNLLVDLLIPVGTVDLTRLKGTAIRVEVPRPGQTPAVLEGKVVSYDHEVSSQGILRIHARVVNQQHQGQWLLLPGMDVAMYAALGQATNELGRAKPLLPSELR